MSTINERPESNSDKFYYKTIEIEDSKEFIILKSENLKLLKQARDVLIDYYKKNGQLSISMIEKENEERKKYDIDYLLQFKDKSFKLSTEICNLIALLNIRRDDCLLIEMEITNDKSNDKSSNDVVEQQSTFTNQQNQQMTKVNCNNNNIDNNEQAFEKNDDHLVVKEKIDDDSNEIKTKTSTTTITTTRINNVRSFSFNADAKPYVPMNVQPTIQVNENTINQQEISLVRRNTMALGDSTNRSTLKSDNNENIKPMKSVQSLIDKFNTTTLKTSNNSNTIDNKSEQKSTGDKAANVTSNYIMTKNHINMIGRNFDVRKM